MIASEELSPAELRCAIDLVYRFTGVTIAASKQSMLQGRLRARMRVLAMDGFAAYLERVADDPVERNAFIDAVTTHQTQFFRTPRVWRFLSDEFLPQWQATHPGGTLQAWSAAASTGQEAYSLAMVCEPMRQATRTSAAPVDYRILASDVSAGSLAEAAAADYGGTAVRLFRQEWPDRFARFNDSETPDRFRPTPALQERIRFETHHLIRPAPRVPGGFELVLLRNVLIYFTPEDCTVVVGRVAEAMAPGALLVIGESESLNGLPVPFEFLLPQIYVRTP